MTKKRNFYKERIRDWKTLHEFQRDGWIFRGQRNSERELRTTLERACRNYGAPLERAADIENVLLREFKRKFHHYSQYIPDRGNNLEWFSLMQHYGAPTRLLDFTYSIYVASYFALEKALEPEETKKAYAVWAINGDWAIKESAKLFERCPEEYEFLIRPIEDKREMAEAFESVFRRDVPVALACPQNPFRLNQRLTIQKGVFVCPGNVALPFEENLCNLPGWEKRENVVEIIIQEGMRRKTLDSLHDMNITRATLFPGLDGFAESLTVSPPRRWDFKS